MNKIALAVSVTAVAWFGGFYIEVFLGWPVSTLAAVCTMGAFILHFNGRRR
ncbi:hypothetical protein [Lawsonibacter celer]|jgi:ABC-type Mn2+/Zn2+ transport system permease subunit|uniref:hypothetical protein n=1 Tax=Lawsonibacter celer TaxID=2986526 RepID=UPI0016481A3C|nr:hypothetical protein [Lawsonibacter celer]